MNRLIMSRRELMKASLVGGALQGVWLMPEFGASSCSVMAADGVKRDDRSPTLVVYGDQFLDHKTPEGHPESPKRLKAVMSALKESPVAKRLAFAKPAAAALEHVKRCHAAEYIASAKKDIESGRTSLTSGDTAVSKSSYQVALLAAGATCVAIDQVMGERFDNAFVVARPPGHHATPKRGMGFCVFNNIAIAARYAQAKYKIGKVLIIDWDVHHGNGTQDIFYEDDSVFFFSTHQSPWYPGTGAAKETGRGKGLGTTLNRPFAAGAGRKEVLGAITDDLTPVMARFKPELVLISAGFDSRAGDPLGRFRLTDEDFVDLTRAVLRIAHEHADNRVVSLLEGGYNLKGLASASAAHCKALVEHPLQARLHHQPHQAVELFDRRRRTGELLR